MRAVAIRETKRASVIRGLCGSGEIRKGSELERAGLRRQKRGALSFGRLNLAEKHLTPAGSGDTSLNLP